MSEPAIDETALNHAVHSALSKYVANWIKANEEEVNFPSKLALNQWRKVLTEGLEKSLQRLLGLETEREKLSEARKEITAAQKDEVAKEDHRAFELVSFLNVISLCQESTSFVITSPERPLNQEQVKSNTTLSQRLLQTQAFLKESDPTSPEAQNLLPHDELLNPTPGKNVPHDREYILDIYFVLKRRFMVTKPSKAQKQRDGSGSQLILRLINKLHAVSPVWPPEPHKGQARFDTMKTMQRTSSDDRLIDQIATQNTRTLSNQRFVMSEQKERKMDLNEIFNVVDKLGIRFEGQTAMSKEQRDAENLAKVADAIDKASQSSMNDQRYTLSQEKIKQLSLTDLVNSVERLASQRMPDCVSPQEKKKEMINVVADIVEKLRAGSMDDQRFISQVATKMNMSARELADSIDSLPLSEASSS